MAFIFGDSWDNYSTTSQKGWQASGGSIQTTGGRNNSGYYRTSAGGTLQRILPTPLVTIGVGAGVNAIFDTDAQANAEVAFFQMVDGTTVQMSVAYNALNRRWRVYRGNAQAGGTLLGSSASNVMPDHSWRHLMVKATISPTVGIVQVYLDTVLIIDLSNVNNRASATSQITHMRLGDHIGTNGNNNFTAFDDFWIIDTTGGSPNNDLLGDARASALFPNGNGNSSQWVGSDGNSTDNYLLADETIPNDDTDYVTSGTVNDKDTYAMTDLPAGSGQVFAVQTTMRARKDDAGARSVASILRSGASEAAGTTWGLGTSYDDFVDVFENKPGGTGWTPSDVNGMEYGPKVIS